MGDLWMSNDTGGWVHVGKTTEDGISIATTEFKVDARQDEPEPINTTVSEILADRPLRALDTRTEYKITIPADKINLHALRIIFGMDVAPTTAPTQEKREMYRVPELSRAHTDHIHWARAIDFHPPIPKREAMARAYGMSEQSINKLRSDDMNDHDVDNGEVDDATRTAIAEFDALEPTDDSTVISWVYERRKTVSAYHFDTETFEYVAIRAAGRWYPTGSIGHKRFGGFSWRELGAMVQTDALRKGDFHIVTGWAHRDDVTDAE